MWWLSCMRSQPLLCMARKIDPRCPLTPTQPRQTPGSFFPWKPFFCCTMPAWLDQALTECSTVRWASRASCRSASASLWLDPPPSLKSSLPTTSSPPLIRWGRRGVNHWLRCICRLEIMCNWRPMFCKVKCHWWYWLEIIRNWKEMFCKVNVTSDTVAPAKLETFWFFFYSLPKRILSPPHLSSFFPGYSKSPPTFRCLPLHLFKLKT